MISIVKLATPVGVEISPPTGVLILYKISLNQNFIAWVSGF